MNILFLTQVLSYPLDAGPKVRAYYVLRYLAQRHNVTLVSFTRPSDTGAAVAHLQEFCKEVYVLPMPRSRLLDAMHLTQSLLINRPFIIKRDWVPAMAQLLRTLVNGHLRFDAVHADQLWMAPYALWIRQLLSERQHSTQDLPLLVLDQHNAVFLIPQRLADHESNPLIRKLLALEARKLARYEVDVCSKFQGVTWVTDADYEAVQHQADRHNIRIPNTSVIPICTDSESALVTTRTGDARRVTFLGGLHYPPNAEGILWFAKEVFPQVLRAVPNAILTVIGKQPPTQLKSIGIPTRNLEVTGYVDDPAPFLQETAAFIVPLHSGGGMRVKILDAWTWGVPVVSTTVGAEGIEIYPGENILIADTPGEFAQATIRLLKNPNLVQQLVMAGREHVLQAYDWRYRYQAWDLVYSQ